MTKIIDCECDGPTCCGGRGIAVFVVERDGKDIKLCTRCDFGSDQNKRILKYVKKLPAEKLINFDSLGALCLANDIEKKTYPLV
jgi:hypothetical protein